MPVLSQVVSVSMRWKVTRPFYPAVVAHHYRRDQATSFLYMPTSITSSSSSRPWSLPPRLPGSGNLLPQALLRPSARPLFLHLLQSHGNQTPLVPRQHASFLSTWKTNSWRIQRPFQVASVTPYPLGDTSTLSGTMARCLCSSRALQT